MTMPRRRLNPDELKTSPNGFKPSPLPVDETVTPNGEPKAACPNPVRADLKAYADGELSLFRRAQVRAHLRNCPACREELADMKKIADLFSAASASETHGDALAPQLRSRVLQQLDNLAPASPAPNGGTVRPIPLWRRQPALVFGGGGSVLAASLAIFYTMNPAHAPKSATGAASDLAVLSYVQEYDEKFPNTGKTEASRSLSAGAKTIAANPPGAPVAATAAAPETSARARYDAGEVAQNQAAAESQTERERSDFSAASPRAVAVPATPLRSAKAMPRPEPTVNGRLRFFDGSASNDLSTEADDGRQVHKEASLGLRVAPGGLQTASDKIEDLVKSTGGFVASNNLTTDDATGEKSADLTVRVPVKDFETVMASLARMGNVVSKQITGEDITEKTTDATTAEQVLVNEATETAQKLARQTMSERRTGQKELELRQIRMQLAQTRARLGLLRRMGALSTINISLTEKQVPKTSGTVAPPKSDFFTGMQETNRAAMQAFQTAVRVPLVLLIWVLAFSPIWVPLIIAYRWASLKSLASRMAAPNAATNDHPING